MKNIVLLSLIASLLTPYQDLAAQSCLCVDTRSNEMIATVKRIVTGTTQGSVQTRAMLNLPGLSASQVTLVANDSSCVRARQAEDSVIHATSPTAPAEIPARGPYVIKLGDYNAVAPRLPHRRKHHARVLQSSVAIPGKHPHSNGAAFVLEARWSVIAPAETHQDVFSREQPWSSPISWTRR